MAWVALHTNPIEKMMIGVAMLLLTLWLVVRILRAKKLFCFRQDLQYL
jgi:hypothetical protein